MPGSDRHWGVVQMRLLLAFPEDLPSDMEQLRAIPSPAVITAAQAIEAGSLDPIALLAVLRPMGLRPDGVKIDRWTSKSSGRRATQFTVLDDFFGVNRVAAGAPEMFSHSAVVAYRTFLTDSVEFGSGLEPDSWNAIRHGLETVICFAVGSDLPRSIDIAVPSGHRNGDPHRRWRSGHQVFFPLIQAIVVGLQCFVSAVTTRSPQRAEAAMNLATEAMAASAAAMRFAADFSPTDYTRYIRPSMTPPGVAQSLSGLMSADHHHLVHAFHELRPLVADLDERIVPAFEAFCAATRGTYDAHVHVCDHFRGNEVASLRMSQSHSMTASDVLTQMGEARMRILEPNS